MTKSHIGRKIPTSPARKQPKPESAKAGAKKMAELMHKKVYKTVAMKEKKNKTAKYV